MTAADQRAEHRGHILLGYVIEGEEEECDADSRQCLRIESPGRDGPRPCRLGSHYRSPTPPPALAVVSRNHNQRLKRTWLVLVE